MNVNLLNFNKTISCFKPKDCYLLSIDKKIVFIAIAIFSVLSLCAAFIYKKNFASSGTLSIKKIPPSFTADDIIKKAEEHFKNHDGKDHIMCQLKNILKKYSGEIKKIDYEKISGSPVQQMMLKSTFGTVITDEFLQEGKEEEEAMCDFLTELGFGPFKLATLEIENDEDVDYKTTINSSSGMISFKLK